MSHYFPKLSEQMPYRCEGCGGWFYVGTMRCLIFHAPGTCCHEYETPATPEVDDDEA